MMFSSYIKFSQKIVRWDINSRNFKDLGPIKAVVCIWVCFSLGFILILELSSIDRTAQGSAPSI